MLIYIFILNFVFLGHGLNTVDNNTIDLQVKEILDEVAQRYLSEENLEIIFSLNIKMAERPERIEKGQIVQSQNKFKVVTNDQDIYCNGNSLWYYLKDNKEVQINDYDGDDSDELGLMSPKGLLKRYESGDFEYALVGKSKEKGLETVEIEFKPVDEFSDYSKLRVTINVHLKSIIGVKAFGKDGSRFTLIVISERFDGQWAESYFEFNANNFPGVTIEDLRLD